jgi:hypothetical protein
VNGPARPPRTPGEFAPDPAPPKPRAVTVSVGLWLVTAIVALVGVVLAVLNLDRLRGDLLAQVLREFPAESVATRERVVVVALGILIGSGVLVALVQLGFAAALNARRRWARVALLPVGLVGAVVLAALPGAALLGVVPAAGAAVSMFLPASNAWFKGRRS